MWSVGKLKSLPGSDVIYYGVDCHGGDRRVTGLKNEMMTCMIVKRMKKRCTLMRMRGQGVSFQACHRLPS